MTAIRSDALVRKKSMLDTRIDGFYLVFALFVVSQYVTFVNYTEAFSSAVDSAMDILRALVLIALIGMIFSVILRILIYSCEMVRCSLCQV